MFRLLLKPPRNMLLNFSAFLYVHILVYPYEADITERSRIWLFFRYFLCMTYVYTQPSAEAHQ